MWGVAGTLTRLLRLPDRINDRLRAMRSNHQRKAKLERIALMLEPLFMV